MPSAIDYRRVRELYEAGLTDAEIRRRTGHAERSIFQWRKGTGRPNNKERSQRILEEKGHELWEDGLSDGKISKRLKVSKRSVWIWRQRHGYAPNYTHTKASVYDHAVGSEWWNRRERIRFLHSEGLTDAEMAEVMSGSADNVARIRQNMELKANKPGRRVVVERDK
jgi:orotate phosphoribosyltransferase-like protein